VLEAADLDRLARALDAAARRIAATVPAAA
jgi:hypothetical protein